MITLADHPRLVADAPGPPTSEAERPPEGRCYETTTSPHQAWRPLDRLGLEILQMARFTGGEQIVATPDRGNIWGEVTWIPGSGYAIAGRPVNGYRGPYANGCFVFTQEGYGR